MKNKSLIYMLPLIDGWSAKAGCPINCFHDSRFPNTIVAIYNKDIIPHGKGIIIFEDDKEVHILHEIDKDFIDDFRLLKEGLFSKLNSDVKSLILQRSEPDLFDQIEGVLYKTKKRKKYLENLLGLTNFDEFSGEYESVINDNEKYMSA